MTADTPSLMYIPYFPVHAFPNCLKVCLALTNLGKVLGPHFQPDSNRRCWSPCRASSPRVNGQLLPCWIPRPGRFQRRAWLAVTMARNHNIHVRRAIVYPVVLLNFTMFKYPSSPTDPLNLSPQELRDYRRKGRCRQLKRRHRRSSEDCKKRDQRHRERERRRSEPPARIDYTPSPSPRTIGQESRRLQLERKVQRRSDDIERRDRRRISRELRMTEAARPAQSNTSSNPTTTPKTSTSRFITTTPTKTIQNNVYNPTPSARLTVSSSVKHPNKPSAKTHLTSPTWPPAVQAAAATTPPTRPPRPRRRPSPKPPSRRS